MKKKQVNQKASLPIGALSLHSSWVSDIFGSWFVNNESNAVLTRADLNEFAEYFGKMLIYNYDGAFIYDTDLRQKRLY